MLGRLLLVIMLARDPTWDARHRGVALTDLATPEALAAAAQMTPERLGLDRVWSVALAERGLESLDADVVGASGGAMLVMRARVSFADETCPLDAPEIRAVTPLAGLELSVRVSIGDTLAVVEDRDHHFRRVYPLGLGGIDTLHVPGRVTSLTPTSDLARLDPQYATRRMTFPKNYQGKPHLPLSLPYPRRSEAPDAPLVYHSTWLAFHIWQGKGFERGFHSHGCLRMRDADLDELAELLFRSAAPLPLRLQASPFPDARHPFPVAPDHYTRLRNFGTAKRPAWRIINDVWVTEAVREAPPQPDALVGLTMDPPSARDPARDDAVPVEGW